MRTSFHSNLSQVMIRSLLCAASSLLLAASAPAAIIYSGLQDVSLPNDPEGVYLNVFTGNVSSSVPGNWSSAPVINPFFGGTAIGTSPLLLPVITGADQILNLAYGTLVGLSSTFAAGESGSSTHVGPAANQFQLGVEGYLGYQFQSTVGGQVYYGFMRITIDNDGSGATIHDWSYDDTGAPIAVPEPGRACLMALGVLALMHRRRRCLPALSGAL